MIPDLVEIGVNVINPVQPDCMDATRSSASSATGWRSGARSARPTRGTSAPDQIRAEVRHRIETLGPAGLLLAPAYDIDFTPPDNIKAFVEAVREFGAVA